MARERLSRSRLVLPGSAVELPLFPLSTVLYPGLPIPLHVFEERYREMFGRVIDGERRFGVVAILHGHEVGGSSVYHPIGCVAEVRDVRRHPDGRLDVVARGERRFRIEGVTQAAPYIVANVATLGETAGDRAAERIEPVAGLFNRYVTSLLEMAGEDEIEPVDLPDDPVAASYLVAAGLQVDLPDKQNLLTVPSASERLRAEISLLRRELSLLDRLAIGGPARLTVSFSLN
jgi:Lon protease-like protein